MGPAAQKGLESILAQRRAGFERGEWCRILEALAPGDFGRLPRGTTLRVRTRDGRELVVTTSKSAYQAARSARVPVFVARELVALAHAAQNERMTRQAFERVLAEKTANPSLVVTPAHAFGGMRLQNAEPLSSSIGEALAEMGCTLERVELERVELERAS